MTTYEARTSDVPVAQLAAGRWVAAVALGVAFWFVGALIIRFGQHSGLLEGWQRIGVFVITIPLTALAIKRVQRTVQTQPGQFIPTMLVLTATALFCDVISLTWFPEIYADTPGDLLSGVILILWGVGWALLLALWRGRLRA